ncbi:MAG: putative rane protein [Thermoleophilaceae bacterium]|jgi:putative membrane protein|nr:putative rane protein [Thermoleophilaceae bacterium]
MTSEGRRLHKAAVLAGVVDQLRGFVLPIVVISALGGHGLGESAIRAGIYTLIGMVVTTIASAVAWSTTRWFIGEDNVRLRSGVLSESITTVPFERVQAIDTVRGPIQRLFGVVEVHVQTAGGGRAAEIVLKAVTPAEAEELREAVRHGGATVAAASEDDGDAEAITWTLSRRDLVIAAATSGSLGVLVPFAAAATQWADDLFGSNAAQQLLPRNPLEAIRDLAVVLAAAWLLSFAGTVVAFAGFRLIRDGERLRVHRGFFERRDASVPVARVHAVRIVEGPLRQPFGLVQLRIDSAGYAHEPATAQTIVPLARRSDAPALIARFLPEFAGELGGLERLPRRSARRYMWPLVWPWAPPAVALALVVGPAGLLLALGTLLGIALGLARYRAAAYRVDGDRVIFRGRRFGCSTAVAKAPRLQEVHVTANLLQRRARLATLVVAIGSGRRIGVKHISADVAERLFATLGLRSLGRVVD